MEPCNLRRWKQRTSQTPQNIHTAGRPGRSLGSRCQVPDETVSLWLERLRHLAPLSILSLLGAKPDGRDEHSFYSFRTADGFRDWLARNAGFDVTIENFPTVDYDEVPRELVREVETAVSAALAAGRSVLIMDSAGVQRSGAVCNAIGLVPDRENPPAGI